MLWTGMTPLLDAIGEKGWVSPWGAKALRTIGVPVLLVAALVWLAVSVVRSGDAAQPQPTAEFVSASGDSYLDVQLNRSAKSFGSFSARVRGEGRVWPAGQVHATSTSAGGVDLYYDGGGYLDPGARADGTASPRRVVRLLLVGRVRLADHTASVDLWVNGTHLTIVSSGEATGAEAVVGQFLVAVSTHDWRRVYELSDRFMRNSARVNDFVNGVGSGAASRITEVTAIGPMTRSTSTAGASFAQIPIRLTYGTGTATTTLRAVLVLVIDGGAWRVFSVQ
jgi:hypothetical protein